MVISDVERIGRDLDPVGARTGYRSTSHTITTMSNDTPETEGHDSQVPLISFGNEDAEGSVAEGMMDEYDSPRPQERPSDEQPDRSSSLDLFDDQFDDTGEMADLAPVVRPSSFDAEPFDYDTYYGAAREWQTSEAPIPVAPEPPRKARDGALFFVGALAAGVLGAALTVGVLAATGTFSEADTPPPSSAETALTAEVTPTTSAPIPNTIITNEIGSAVNPSAVALKAIPSIVTVSTSTGTGETAVGVGSGSGVVLTSDGYIATNEHVVDGATSYTVTFEDGRVYTAELIGMDALTDLAVLKIEATGLTPIDLGSTDGLLLGDPAIAVGNPLGQVGGSSVSSGIVSAFNRSVDFSDGSTLFGMIQTDAAINSGSSGGALVNSEGQLIGITAAIGVSSAGPEGIGYAIPVELVQRITAEIIENGSVAHPFLGVTIGTFAEEQSDGAILPTGAEVVSLEGEDSAAAAAGLQVGDVIVRIGDEEITSQTDLILAVRLYRVGDEVEFEAIRNGQSETFTVVLGQRPAEFGG